MRSGEIVREARRRARLSQRELADLLGTTQPVIARWEAGTSSPAFDRVVEAVRACGLDLAVRVVARDDQHALLVRQNLVLTPAQRLERLRAGRAAVEDMAARAQRRGTGRAVRAG